MTLRELKGFQTAFFKNEIHCIAGRVAGISRVTDQLYYGWYDGRDGSGAFNYIPRIDGEDWLDEEIMLYDVVPPIVCETERAKWEGVFKNLKQEYKAEFK